MKLVHYRKISQIQDCLNNGIPMQRKAGRLHGVFASPLLNFSHTVTRNWKRRLTNDRRVRLGAIIFEIEDGQEVYYSKDWSHTALGASRLVTAREAEALTFELGRYNAVPLTPEQYEAAVQMENDTATSYDFGLMEIIVPSSIRPNQIIRVEFATGKKNRQATFDSELLALEDDLFE
ncbi:MAG: hypothetical protein Q8T09_00210 [Candidatus Melainabacteria bacterium]|nr:hypothetical protein [Candidatus Melainabacteria bacterium]